MDYKIKYEKYKFKYISLKSEINAIDAINKIDIFFIIFNY